MRNLTVGEIALREHRRAEFQGFVRERIPVLIDFAERLRLIEPQSIVTDPKRYVAPISDFMRDQVITEDDRIWVLTRIGYLIGDVLARTFNGDWLLNEMPDSRYFLHYVVGRFSGVKNPNAMVAPFEAAQYFVSQPPGRDLAGLIAEIEATVSVS